jgi:hypothetical protein
MPSDRVIIVGGPMAGKSTLARTMRADGYPTFCGDPRSTVREPEGDVTYLPEGLDWSSGSQFVVDRWFTMSGPWVLEGHVMARALRKQLAAGGGIPADRILVLPEPLGRLTPAQASMTKAVKTVWCGIKPRLAGVVEYPAVGGDDAAPSPMDAWRDLAARLTF